MTNECTPKQVLDFLSRKTQPETVCVIEPHWDNRLIWLNNFAKLLDAEKCDKYSVDRKTLSVRVQWKYDGPEHVVYLFESHEEGCKAAYKSVCYGKM